MREAENRIMYAVQNDNSGSSNYPE